MKLNRKVLRKMVLKEMASYIDKYAPKYEQIFKSIKVAEGHEYFSHDEWAELITFTVTMMNGFIKTFEITRGDARDNYNTYGEPYHDIFPILRRDVIEDYIGVDNILKNELHLNDQAIINRAEQIYSTLLSQDHIDLSEDPRGDWW